MHYHDRKHACGTNQGVTIEGVETLLQPSFYVGIYGWPQVKLAWCKAVNFLLKPDVVDNVESLEIWLKKCFKMLCFLTINKKASNLVNS